MYTSGILYTMQATAETNNSKRPPNTTIRSSLFFYKISPRYCSCNLLKDLVTESVTLSLHIKSKI